MEHFSHRIVRCKAVTPIYNNLHQRLFLLPDTLSLFPICFPSFLYFLDFFFHLYQLLPFFFVFLSVSLLLPPNPQRQHSYFLSHFCSIYASVCLCMCVCISVCVPLVTRCRASLGTYWLPQTLSVGQLTPTAPPHWPTSQDGSPLKVKWQIDLPVIHTQSCILCELSEEQSLRRLCLLSPESLGTFQTCSCTSVDLLPLLNLFFLRNTQRAAAQLNKWSTKLQ